jgi:glycosyltransferase involved in cell wall biosynthesis
MTFRSLADISPKVRDGGKPLKVCVVSSEFLGPVKNGGIATATSGLLTQLAKDGHDVTLLYTLVEYGVPWSGDRPWGHWVWAREKEGITLTHIKHSGDYRSWREKSWCVKEAIAAGEFDVVYFNEHHGNGYYSLLAKRCGIHPFASQLHCVITHGSIEWVFDINDQYANRAADVEMIGLERRTVELADLIIAPSGYLLKQYQSYGWQLAPHVVQPYAIFQNPKKIPADGSVPVDELVFFGRLETRKGLWLFCEALTALGPELDGKTVTFLGRMTDTSGVSSGVQIINRAGKWPCRVKLLTNFDQEEAINYLRQPGRVAVMPSLADNSPCVIYECMESGIPFLTTLGSGAEELIHPDSWKDVMCEPDATSLAKAVNHILRRGASFGRPRFDPVENLKVWSKWHAALAADREPFIIPSVTVNGAPSQPSRAALVVVIDRGNCRLSTLIDNLTSHLKRFGPRAAYLVVSSRGAKFQQVILDLFAASEQPAAVAFLPTEELGEALQIIAASKFVIVTDAEVEISTAFFAMALNILGQHEQVVVSCAVGMRANPDAEIEMDDPPTGDIPGLSALGYPMGGAIWAVTPQGLADKLFGLSWYNAEEDELNSAQELAQGILQVAQSAKIPIHVLPMVGGVHLGPRPPVLGRSIQLAARTSAATFGIRQSIYKGGAAWLSVSGYGPDPDDMSQQAAEFTSEISQQHPISWLAPKPEQDLAAFAAALCRPELALQLQAGNAGASSSRRILDVATEAMRLTPLINLSEALVQGQVLEYGTTQLPETHEFRKSKLQRVAAGLTRAAQEIPVKRTGITAFIDGRRVQLDSSRILVEEGDKPARLVFADVPLRGQSALSVHITSSAAVPTGVRASVWDQRTGEQVAAGRVVPGKGKPELTVLIDKLWCSATVIIEFEGEESAQIAAEITLR